MTRQNWPCGNHSPRAKHFIQNQEEGFFDELKPMKYFNLQSHNKKETFFGQLQSGIEHIKFDLLENICDKKILVFKSIIIYLTLAVEPDMIVSF